MKKLLKVLVPILSFIMVLAFAGCGENPGNSEIDQWDYFDEYVYYTLYDYIEDNKDWSKNLITNSAGEVQQNCYQTFLSLDNNVSIKDIRSHSDYNFYRQISISRSNDKKITITKLSIQIYTEANCEMKFSLSISGDKNPRGTATVNAVANTATELLFENFAEYTWDENSKGTITINIENPGAIGNVKYGFSDLKLTLKRV